MKRLLTSTLVLAALSAAPASAFDGQRPGFAMGLQAGIGQAEHTAQAGEGETGYDGLALATAWRLGYGPSESLWVYAVNRACFFEGDGPDDRVQGLAGLGASWSFTGRGWPLYLAAEAGMAVHRNRITAQDQEGFGFALGLGVEVRRHVALELSWLDGSVGGDASPDQDLRSFALSFGWLGY